MVDLKSQYLKIKSAVDEEIQRVIDSSAFIKGEAVAEFENNLATYLNVNHVISCGNGTDALQIALMALGLTRGDEVIVTSFSFIATAEVIALLGLEPIFVDVDQDTFNIDVESIKEAITPKTKAIIPVHLFGQCANMNEIMDIAHEHNLYVIEDNAQAIGADYLIKNENHKAGTIGHIGCTSFFPSKNLGAYGDGGALFTNSDELADQIRMIVNHGSKVKYYHEVLGVNSRLDTLQAAVLNVKLKYLDEYIAARQKAASFYDNAFRNTPMLQIPFRAKESSHVFHQYTIIIENNSLRDYLKYTLSNKSIPSMIYYPVPLHKQTAFKKFSKDMCLRNAEELSKKVLSLLMHTELKSQQLAYIGNTVNTIIDTYQEN